MFTGVPIRSIDLRPGLLVMAGDRKLELLPSQAASKIQAKDLDTGEIVVISAGDVDFEIDSRESDSQSTSKIARSTSKLIADWSAAGGALETVKRPDAQGLFIHQRSR